MSTPIDRRSLVESVIGLTGSFEADLAALATFGPAQAGSSVQVDRFSLRRALRAFEEGRLSADQMERWAEFVHGADDVTLDPTDEEFLSAAVFELSTPELFGSMSRIVADLRDRDHSWK